MAVSAIPSFFELIFMIIKQIIKIIHLIFSKYLWYTLYYIYYFLIKIYNFFDDDELFEYKIIIAGFVIVFTLKIGMTCFFSGAKRLNYYIQPELDLNIQTIFSNYIQPELDWNVQSISSKCQKKVATKRKM